jgi:hypothetical protein
MAICPDEDGFTAGFGRKCTLFRANTPYFEQMPEKLDPQVKRNQDVARRKANKERMDLAEIGVQEAGNGE